MTAKTPTMRELMRRARTRWGPGAARFKTRAELLAALDVDPPATVAARPATSPRPSSPGRARRAEPAPAPPEPLVTRDFFRDPESAG